MGAKLLGLLQGSQFKVRLLPDGGNVSYLQRSSLSRLFKSATLLHNFRRHMPAIAVNRHD
jgi:hypothetical protein